MAKLGLWSTVCAVALLAATPVLAQSNTETGATGVGGSVVAPTTHEAMPGGSSGTAATGTKKPIQATGGSSDGSTQAMMKNHPAHHAGMGMHAAMHPRNQANAQNTAVDMLNDQSYQAAQKGQMFGGSPAATGMGKSGMTGGPAATGMDKSGSMTGGSPGKM